MIRNDFSGYKHLNKISSKRQKKDKSSALNKLSTSNFQKT